MTAVRDETRPSAPDRQPRLLVRLSGGLYSIPVGEIGGLARPGALRSVPLAPPAVVGLTEYRGALLTVIDLPRLLGHDPADGPRTLIRLAAPFDHTALLVRGSVRFLIDDEPDDVVDRGPVRPLDTRMLLERMRDELIASARAGSPVIRPPGGAR